MSGSKFLPFLMLSFFALFFTNTNPVTAQPQSYLYIHSTDGVLQDLNAIVEKMGGEAKAWTEKVKPNIEIFLGGIESNQPLLFEIQLDLKETKYITSFPVTPGNQKAFLSNLNSLGVKNKNIGSKYQLRSAYNGFLVFDNNYAHISSEAADLEKDKLHDVKKLSANFISNKSDVAYWIHNTTEKQKERTDAFAVFSKKILENIPDRPKLSKEENVLAKLGIKQQLEELQRYFVESKTIDLDWTTDAEKSAGEGHLLFEALEQTSLQKSLSLATNNVSLFQNVTSEKNAIVSGRSFFPLDDFRKKQLNDFYIAFRPVLKQRLETVKILNDDQKKASKEAADILIDILTASIPMDTLDSFVEMQPDASGLNKVIAGSRLIGSDKVKLLLEKLVKVDTKATLTLDKVTVADVKFHELILKDHVPVGLKMLFGETPRILIGTRVKEGGKEETVWIAAGEKTEEDLKRVLDQASAPRKASESQITLLSWKSSMAAVLKAIDAELLDNGKKDENRAVLVKALAEKDGNVDSRLYLEKNQVKGFLNVDEGFLRAVGKLIAEATKAL